MGKTVATITQITGTCNAGYRVGDQVVVNRDTACIDKQRSDSLCIFALSAILASLCRLKPGERGLASCPDPATGQGGNVIFEITGEENA